MPWIIRASIDWRGERRGAIEGAGMASTTWSGHDLPVGPRADRAERRPAARGAGRSHPALTIVIVGIYYEPGCYGSKHRGGLSAGLEMDWGFANLARPSLRTPFPNPESLWRRIGASDWGSQISRDLPADPQSHPDPCSASICYTWHQSCAAGLRRVCERASGRSRIGTHRAAGIRHRPYILLLLGLAC